MLTKSNRHIRVLAVYNSTALCKPVVKQTKFCWSLQGADPFHKAAAATATVAAASGILTKTFIKLMK
ncbi:hypothetical protein ABBQ38_015157 [Trebouxia sp. C0009 RCD-2024]